MTTGYQQQGGGTGLAAYHQESAARCPLNGSCDCCTCRCCGLFILILWVIFGGYGAISSLSLNSDLTTYPAGSDTCESQFLSGECCQVTTMGSTGYIDGSCDPFKTALEIDAATSILSALAGVIGIIGMAMFIAWMLLIPAGWSILSVILNIVVLVYMGFGAYAYGSFISFGIAACICVLFYSNYKLMRDTDPKGGI